MSAILLEEPVVLGPESAGLLMTAKEFDSITEYDECYRYELVNGVVIVSPIPLPEERHPNDLLAHALLTYQETHPQGKTLDLTLAQQYVRIGSRRRIADRVIWVGLRRTPNLRKDVPTIAVEFVSGTKRDRQRDYVDKRREYRKAGIPEYWIFDRFKRTLTVIQNRARSSTQKVIKERQSYESPLLPGFRVPLRRLLEAADRFAKVD